MPLHDAAGSTVALINAFSGAIDTQYTYDPAGAVGTSGAANSYPYLYSGMEYDVWTGLYHTMSNYYSPQLIRPLSEMGPTGGGGGGAIAAGGASGGGASAFSSSSNRRNGAIGLGVGALTDLIGAGEILCNAAAVTETLSLYALGQALWAAGPYAWAVMAAFDLSLFFLDLFGGSPSIPYQTAAPGAQS